MVRVDSHSPHPLESESIPSPAKSFWRPSDMALIQFTKNHTDHSTDKGFQFEFFL